MQTKKMSFNFRDIVFFSFVTCEHRSHEVVGQGRRLNVRDKDGGGGASRGGSCNRAQGRGGGEEGGGGGGGGDEGEGGGGDDPLGLHHRQILRYGDGRA